MKTVWITGSSGYTAPFLARYLKSIREQDFFIVGLSRRRSRFEDLFDQQQSIDLGHHSAITKINTLPAPDLVFHLAAITPPADQQLMWQVNVDGTINLMKALEYFSGKGKKITFVNIGSAAEYSIKNQMPLDEGSRVCGESPYGKTKWLQSISSLELGRHFSINVIVARTFNLIGPGLPEKFVAGTICSQIKRGDSVKIGNVNAQRDFVDVRDAVRAYYLLAVKGKPYNFYNVCSGKAISIKELLDKFLQLSGKSPEVSFITSAKEDIVYGSGKKIKELTGWTPQIKLEETITDMLNSKGV